MSDPSRDGYQCHGPMRSIEIRGLHDGVAVWVCRCGVWRHAFSPSDARRQAVEIWMHQHGAAVTDGEVGEVS